jgi:hypothetical protein
MGRAIGTIIVHLLSLGTVVRLFIALPKAEQEQAIWQTGFALLCIILLVAIVWEVITYMRSGPRRYYLFKKRRIRNFMRRWLLSGGRAVIFTRDMSWAGDESIRQVLVEKAQRNELTICIETVIPLAAQLATLGAQVISCGELEVVPRSRYTIIDFERDGARVAVGGTVGRHHVIQEFRSGDHPFFAVAEDLARLLIAYDRRQNAAAC